MKHEPKPPRRKLRDLGPIIRRRPAVFAVYLVLRLIVIAVLSPPACMRRPVCWA